jgi:hypothetical protein
VVNTPIFEMIIHVQIVSFVIYIFISGEVPAQPALVGGSMTAPEGAEISIIRDSGLRMTFLCRAAPAAVDQSLAPGAGGGLTAVLHIAKPRHAQPLDAAAAVAASPGLDRL